MQDIFPPLVNWQVITWIYYGAWKKKKDKKYETGFQVLYIYGIR
jgi:hypothetical protein